MKYFDWNESKNDKLREERDVCFEDVLAAIDSGRILDDLEHHNKEHYLAQRILVVNIDGYAYLVPYIEDEEKLFLKTIIPSRKATKKYMKGDS